MLCHMKTYNNPNIVVHIYVSLFYILMDCTYNKYIDFVYIVIYYICFLFLLFYVVCTVIFCFLCHNFVNYVCVFCNVILIIFVVIKVHSNQWISSGLGRQC